VTVTLASATVRRGCPIVTTAAIAAPQRRLATATFVIWPDVRNAMPETGRLAHDPVRPDPSSFRFRTLASAPSVRMPAESNPDDSPTSLIVLSRPSRVTPFGISIVSFVVQLDFSVHWVGVFVNWHPFGFGLA
jgi:hypothetical protein